MNDRQRQYILEIAAEKSVSKAAEKLYISQSSLSQTLKLVEEELDTKLFRRRIVPLELTYAGEQFIKSTQQILNIHENMLRIIEEINQTKRGKIKLGIAPSRCSLLMPYILPSFMQRFPKVEVEFIEENQEKLEQLLLDNKIDLFFTTKPYTDKRITYEEIYLEHFILLISRHDAEKYFPLGLSKNIRDYEHLPFVLLNKFNDMRKICSDNFEYYKMRPNIVLEFDRLQSCLQMASANLGVTIVPEPYYKEYQHNQELLSVPIDELFFRPTALGYSSDLLDSTIVKEFISTICSETLRFIKSVRIFNKEQQEEYFNH